MNPTRKGALLHARACLHREEVRHSRSLQGSMPPFLPHLGLLSIPPCLAHCNASFPCSRASLPLPRTVCPCPAYLHREATRVAAEYARVRGAAVKTCESMGKKRYNVRDRVGYFRAKCDFDLQRWNFGKIFGHMRVLIKAKLLPQSKFSKVNIQASHSHWRCA